MEQLTTKNSPPGMLQQGWQSESGATPTKEERWKINL